VEPGNRPELLPQLRLDELLGELQARLQAVLATRDQMRGLLQAVVAISSGLDLESTLRRIVETAVGLVDATYGALGVIGEDGRLAEFIPIGLSSAEIERIHHWPEGHGLLGLLIDDPRPLRLADITDRAESSGFPAGHPPMGSFLGVQVRIRDEVFGNLYLTNKRGGGEFTDDDEAVLIALGAAAAVAVENARLYETARRQQRWVQASAEVTTRLLSGSAPAEVLTDVTRQARELSGADLAVLALPGDSGRRLTITYADGDGADATRGLVLPVSESLSGRVLATGGSVASDDFAADERASQAARGAMAHIGPAVLFPLGAPGNVRGVLTVGRRHGAAAFPQAQVDVAASFAAQAGVALELAATRAEAQRVLLYEDRDRIARDLHDLVIQRLFATGMSLEGTMPMITRPEVASRITHAVDAMDETIKDIRGTIFALQAPDPADQPDLRGDVVALVEEITPMLGFAPSLRLGAGLATPIGAELGEQVLAALREALSNAARHAGASQVDVTVDVTPDGILAVQVTDDGTGIPASAHRSGLRNLAHRAEKLGGELRLRPAHPGAPAPGTRLEWRVPAGAKDAEASLASETIRIMSSFRANGLSGRAPSASHGRRVIRGGLLAGNAKAAAVQYLRRNPDEVFPHPRGPRGETHLLQLADFRGIGHFPRLSDGGDAPPGPLVGVQAIDFERDDGMLDGDGDLAAAIGPDDDVAVVEREVDQFDRGQRSPGIDDPADGHRCHQPEAFIPGQLLEGRAVGVHVYEDAWSPPWAPGNKVPSRGALSTSRRYPCCADCAGRRRRGRRRRRPGSGAPCRA
jgi:signal transduction histidine kinase